MSGTRELLAAASALSGLILLVLAARGVLLGKTRTRARSLALGVYGFLFVFAGVVLWTRGETGRIPDAVSPRPGIQAREPSTQEEPTSVADQRSGAPATQPSSMSAPSDSFSPDPLSQPRVMGEPGKLSGLNQEEARVRRAGRKPWPGKQAIPASPDERVALAVLRTFDAIERWFMRHGSPRPASTHGNIPAAGREGQLELPEIVFLGQTAELTPEGARRLKQLAGRLQSLPDSGVIEIHARTDDADPTPFPFILTQARAEVVRDFLMNEGVRNYRLVTQAVRSDSEDSTTAGHQVRLVFRP